MKIYKNVLKLMKKIQQLTIKQQFINNDTEIESNIKN